MVESVVVLSDATPRPQVSTAGAAGSREICRKGERDSKRQYTRRDSKRSTRTTVPGDGRQANPEEFESFSQSGRSKGNPLIYSRAG